jgi:integration host factor subunit alpha
MQNTKLHGDDSRSSRSSKLLYPSCCGKFVEFKNMMKPDALLAGKPAEAPRASSAPAPALDGAGSRTVTRVDLAEAVYQQVGLSRKESALLVEMILGELTSALLTGDSVKLSSFGSFLIRHKGERIGRNPKTGVEVPITERRVLVFKPSNVLKARLNGQTIEAGGDD